MPSNLPTLYWKYSFNDVKTKLKLYLGREQALVIQSYDTLALLVEQAFGDGKPSTPEPAVRVASTLTEMQAAFGSMFGNGT